MLVYLADEDTNGLVELYSVPVSGGVTTKLNGILPGGGDVDSLFSVSPDGMRVIYRADEETEDANRSVREIRKITETLLAEKLAKPPPPPPPPKKRRKPAKKKSAQDNGAPVDSVVAESDGIG